MKTTNLQPSSLLRHVGVLCTLGGLLVAGVYVWIGVAVLRRKSLIALIRFSDIRTP